MVSLKMELTDAVAWPRSVNCLSKTLRKVELQALVHACKTASWDNLCVKKQEFNFRVITDLETFLDECNMG
jgi:hypothetical protein